MREREREGEEGRGREGGKGGSERRRERTMEGGKGGRERRGIYGQRDEGEKR